MLLSHPSLSAFFRWPVEVRQRVRPFHILVYRPSSPSHKVFKLRSLTLLGPTVDVAKVAAGKDWAAKRLEKGSFLRVDFTLKFSGRAMKLILWHTMNFFYSWRAVL